MDVKRAMNIKSQVDRLEDILTYFIGYMDVDGERTKRVDWEDLDEGIAAMSEYITELKREYYLAIEEVPACSS